MPTLTNTLSTKKKIVLKRWQARQYFWQAWQSMPATIEIRNDSEGNRLAEEDRYTKSLAYTLFKLREIGICIFHKNFESHYVGMSLESNTRISYASIPENKFNRNNRMRTRLGRYITRNFQEIVQEEMFIERGLDMLVEKFMALAEDDIDQYFYKLQGEEIVEAYRDSFADSSCMTNEGHECTQMYSNLEVCQMLCMDDGKYKGRALLWDTEEGPFLDRIYPNSGPHIDKYEIYCKKHGIAMRNDNYCPSTGPIESRTKTWPSVKSKCGRTLSIKVKIPPGLAPYTDTIHWGTWINEVTGEALLYSDPSEHGGTPDIALNSTDGDLTHYRYCECRVCQEKDFRGSTERVYDAWAKERDIRVCSVCIDKISNCDSCCKMHFIDDMITALSITNTQVHMCLNCSSRWMKVCEDCNEVVPYELIESGKTYCESCFIQAKAKAVIEYVINKELAYKESIRNESV